MAWLFDNVSGQFSNLWANSGSYVISIMASFQTILFSLYLILVLVTIIALHLLQIPTEIVFIGLLLILTYFHRMSFYLLVLVVGGELILLYVLLHLNNVLLNSNRILDLLDFQCLSGRLSHGLGVGKYLIKL